MGIIQFFVELAIVAFLGIVGDIRRSSKNIPNPHWDWAIDPKAQNIL